MFHQAATESMCLSIQTGYSSAWTTILQGAAIANTAAAVGIAAGSLASTLKSESDFYKMATPDNLDTTYADAFADVIPDASAALALATTIALGVAAVLQEISEVVAQGLPKIEMTPLGLTLSCGEGTEMVLDDTGLYINAPIFYVAAGEIEMVSLAGITCEAEGTAVFTVPDVAFTGNVDIGSNMMVLGNGQVAGQLTATLVEA
jgi:hypothetical protein